MKTLFILVLILIAINQGIQLFSKPKEAIKQVEVTRPVEVVRYVEVPKIVERIVEVPARRVTHLKNHSYEARRFR